MCELNLSWGGKCPVLKSLWGHWHSASKRPSLGCSRRDSGWSSCFVSHWSSSVQWPWWLPWWLDNHDDTLGRGSGIKGKGLLLPRVVSCWICSCELQSMLLRRYWTWSAVSFATHLLVAAPTDVVVWVHPNLQSSRTSDRSAQQGAARLVARSTR